MSEAGNDRCWISLRHSDLGDAAHNLDSLLGHLYDDIESKVQASHRIYLMSLDIDRLAAMASHGTVMGALARVLREEGRKSFDLRFNTISTFQIFSYFRDFHQLLITNQIGRVTLSFLDLETLRIHNIPTTSSSAGRKAQSPEQEKFLYMSICILYHIAEDLQIEKKMRRFNLVECLCEVLHRTNTTLLSITVAFLRRLSVYIENLNSMRENSLALKLLHILHAEDESLLSGVLRLLWNLSFERGFKEDMIDCGFLHVFEGLLQKRKFDRWVWTILYNLSSDFDLRLKILEFKILPVLIESFLAEHDATIPSELSALVINLTNVPKTAMLNLKPPHFEKFVEYASGTNDMLLFKVVKNLSLLEGSRVHFIPFVPALVDSLLQCEPCIQVEVMETFSNLTSSKELHDTLVSDSRLLDYVAAHLHPSNTEDDINLQIIMFVGGACSDRSVSTISRVGLVEKTNDFFVDRPNDVDIALQSLYAMNRFMLFGSTRTAYLQSFGKVVDRVLQLSQDSEKALVSMADLVLDAVANSDNSKKDLIRSMRFNMHNSAWSEAY